MEVGGFIIKTPKTKTTATKQQILTTKTEDNKNNLTMSPPIACETMSMPMAMAVPIPGNDTPVIQGQPLSAPNTAAFNRVTSKLNEDQIKRLMEQGYSRGLATSLNDSKKAFSHHFWILDNSGSMAKLDGHRMAETRNRNTVKMIPCTRWEEIQECTNYHIQLAGLLNTPTRFRVSQNVLSYMVVHNSLPLFSHRFLSFSF